MVLANVDQDVNNNIQIMCYDEEYNNSTDMEGGTSTNWLLIKIFCNIIFKYLIVFL